MVDDGSTDGTAEAVQKYGAEIRYFYQQNSGPAVARNRGIDESSGEWIAFLDADDEWLPHWISTQESIITNCPSVRWSWCNYERTVNGTVSKKQSCEARHFVGLVEYFDARLNGFAIGGTPGFLIHRSVMPCDIQVLRIIQLSAGGIGTTIRTALRKRNTHEIRNFKVYLRTSSLANLWERMFSKHTIHTHEDCFWIFSCSQQLERLR